MKFQMVKLDLEKAEEAEIKLPISVVSLKSKQVPEKPVKGSPQPSLSQRGWVLGVHGLGEKTEENLVPGKTS